ncbi:MAG: hypothetical protein IJL02_09220 [Methanobrevibacter sp.]|uniref:hypothetical protein n=1 Tax=Methanobrevibacter sp. TaxID=66852 RepID=UPI0025F051D2|nr:hypothetical protein [Methanobrevibacter sp.]MBQ6100020.1 hypothetical protein [Methanobrevibacter sp.]
MEKQILISSYDEENDTFMGKIDGRNGYCADYGISDGVFLSVDKDNMPASVFISNASKVFDISKQILENANVKIDIDCDSICLYFTMFIENSEICSIRCKNSYGIPNINFEMDSNY